MSERHSSIACYLISEDRNRRKDIVCYLVIKDIGGLKILKEPIYMRLENMERLRNTQGHCLLLDD